MRTPGNTEGIAVRAALWSTRHRTVAIAGWLLFVVAITVLSGYAGTRQATAADFGTGESGRGDQILAGAGFTDRAGELVLISSDTRTVEDPAFRAAIAEVIKAVDGTGAAYPVASPLDADGAPLVSADRRAALVRFELRGERWSAADRVGPVLAAVAGVQRTHPDLYVGQAGDASADKLLDEELDRGLNRLSLLSIPLTLGILLVAFGALVASLIPVGLAITALVAAVGLLAFASRAAPTVDTTTHVMLLIGLAVGVDYCLFYISRAREERDRGADPHRALVIAAQTSGRSVWISGLTVVVAMAGMCLTRDTTFVSFAVGTILVVGTAVLGSLTVLPALLSALGDRVDLGRVPGLYRRRSTGRGWRAVLTVVLRRPLLSALIAAAALGALAAPAAHLHTTAESINDFSDSVPVVETFQRISRAFPGGADPAEVVLTGADVTGPGVTAAIEKFRTAAVATGVLREPIAVAVNPDRSVAVIRIGHAGSGTDAAAEQAITTLRTTVVPATLRGAPGVTEVAVTGPTAGSLDFNAALERSLPLVFGFVLGLAFLLLLVSFRSVVVALTGIALNLASVAAAYGLIVLVFQDGFGAGLLDAPVTGGITNWLPLFLFVILFGLSMDYHVFVLSRIREGHDRGLPNRQAVAEGIAGTAGVITNAALVMVAVFAIFITLPVASTKQLGFGLAVAILLDATLVRAVLLPAVMVLLGEANWYLPRWLSWLPLVSHPVTAPPVANAVPAGTVPAGTVPAGTVPAGTVPDQAAADQDQNNFGDVVASRTP